MADNDRKYITDDKEEIFWIIISFFAKEYKEQKKLINNFSLTKFPSNFNGDITSQIIFILAWCYRNYLPDFEKYLYQIAIELHALFGLIENYSLAIKKEGFEQHLLTLNSIEEDEIWSLVRRLSNLILKTWGMEPYNFEIKLDLDHIGPEIF
jgi:hypothetical protein